MTWHLITDPDNQPPKDGTVVFVWWPHRLNTLDPLDSCVRKANYVPLLEEWRMEGYEGIYPPAITHWAPMLPPPDTQE